MSAGEEAIGIFGLLLMLAGFFLAVLWVIFPFVVWYYLKALLEHAESQANYLRSIRISVAPEMQRTTTCPYCYVTLRYHEDDSGTLAVCKCHRKIYLPQARRTEDLREGG